MRIRDVAADVESKYWKFRHEKFQRGRPDLLSEIRKSNHTEAADKQEVDALKTEVKELKSQLANMSNDMEKLASLVGDMMKTQQQKKEQQQQPHKNTKYIQPESGCKKRRVMVKTEPTHDLPSPVKSSLPPLNDLPTLPQPLPVTSLPDPSTARDSDLYDVSTSLAQSGIDTTMSDLPTPSKLAHRDESMTALTSADEEILASLFSYESSEDENFLDANSTDVPDLAVSLPPSDLIKQSEPDPKLLKKMRESLSRLPKNLQELFVERLVAAITNPEAFQNQVEAVSALASAAAEEAKKRLESLGDDANVENNDRSIELATAVLGSFLSRYGASLNTSGATRPGVS